MKFDKEINVITEFKTTLQEYIDLISLHFTPEEHVQPLQKKLSTLMGKIGNYDVPRSSNKSPKYSLAFSASAFFNDSINGLLAHINYLEQVIAHYQYHQNEFKRKRFNPIYWIGEIIRLPFYLFSFAGFDINKIEFSIFGKLWKFIMPIIVFLAALVTILKFCNIHLSDIF